MGSIDVIASLRIKHAALADAAAKLGSQAALGEYLGVHQTEIGRWCNLLGCPPRHATKTWPAERIAGVESKLLQLTGQTLDALFPDELRASCEKNSSPRRFERRIEIECDALNHLGSIQIERLTLPSPVDACCDAELKQRVESVLQSLSFREREVIKLRFGIGGSTHCHSLEETGRILKVTRERVRQIEARAIRKMQTPARSIVLSEFVDG